MEKLPPHNIEAEQGVLSAMLIDPASLSQVADFLRPDDFYRETHRLIYEAILMLDRRKTEIDFITISDELARQGHLEAIGGSSYLVQCLADVEATSGRIEHHARIIQRLRQLRDVIKVAGEMVANAYALNEQTVSLASESLYRIEQGRSIRRVTSLPDAIDRYMTKLDKVYDARKRGEVAGVPTGFRVLDQVLGGFQPSDLIVLAARPATGKTSLCLNFAHHIMGDSMRTGHNVLMFSLEMGEEQLVRRLLSMESQIDQTRLRSGDIDDDDWQTLVDASGKLSEGKMWIDDTPAISLQDMRSRARRVQSEYGLDLIIVDYMQLMKATTESGKAAENRVQEVSLLSRGLKELARELNVPVVALAQLSRAVEQRADKIPILSDLRESGSIEQDSDVIMFIHQDGNIPASERGYILNIIVAKHRNGPTGTSPLLFNPRLTRFYDVEEYLREE